MCRRERNCAQPVVSSLFQAKCSGTNGQGCDFPAARARGTEKERRRRVFDERTNHRAQPFSPAAITHRVPGVHFKTAPKKGLNAHFQVSIKINSLNAARQSTRTTTNHLLARHKSIIKFRRSFSLCVG
jgi:hypothetical protein